MTFEISGNVNPNPEARIEVRGSKNRNLSALQYIRHIPLQKGDHMGKILDAALERLTGVSIEDLRDLPLSDARNAAVEQVEKAEKSPVIPAIGYGYVRDYVRNHAVSEKNKKAGEELVQKFESILCK